jgi:hypothetical protein
VSRLLVGTSGWSYPSWRPGFYPADADPSEFLRLYAEQFDAVELNSTGYRLPSSAQFERWAESVPVGFRFAVKAPPGALRRIDTVQERVLTLGARLGCVRLVVEAPRDDGLLELLLGSADPAVRWALDLRDASWDGVEPLLAEAGAIRVGDLITPSAWRYVRFRDPPCGDDALDAAAAVLTECLGRDETVLAFFRHETAPTAPAYALVLAERVRLRAE